MENENTFYLGPKVKSRAGQGFYISLCCGKRGGLSVMEGTSLPAEAGCCFSLERPGDSSKRLHSESPLIPRLAWEEWRGRAEPSPSLR